MPHQPHVTESLLRIAHTDEVPPGAMKAASLHGRPIAIANIDGWFVAFQNRCLHYGIRLSDGVLTGPVLTCRWHQWSYDVCSGRVLAEESPYESFLTFPVMIRDDEIYVDPQPRTTIRRRPGEGA